VAHEVGLDDADSFAAWRLAAYATLNDPEPAIVPLGHFEQSAREFLLDNGHLSENQRAGLKIIRDDFKIRDRRHWYIGMSLFATAPPTAVIMLYVPEHGAPRE